MKTGYNDVVHSVVSGTEQVFFCICRLDEKRRIRWISDFFGYFIRAISFSPSFNKYLMRSYYRPGTVLDAGKTSICCLRLATQWDGTLL